MRTEHNKVFLWGGDDNEFAMMNFIKPAQRTSSVLGSVLGSKLTAH